MLVFLQVLHFVYQLVRFWWDRRRWVRTRPSNSGEGPSRLQPCMSQTCPPITTFLVITSLNLLCWWVWLVFKYFQIGQWYFSDTSLQKAPVDLYLTIVGHKTTAPWNPGQAYDRVNCWDDCSSTRAHNVDTDRANQTGWTWNQRCMRSSKSLTRTNRGKQEWRMNYNIEEDRGFTSKMTNWGGRNWLWSYQEKWKTESFLTWKPTRQPLLLTSPPTK